MNVKQRQNKASNTGHNYYCLWLYAYFLLIIVILFFYIQATFDRKKRVEEEVRCSQY
jgi:hypothetical protein